MLRINTHSLYLLGKNLAPIGDLDENNTSYGQALWPLINARVGVQTLLRDAALPVRTCRQPATQLVNAINAVVPEDIHEAVAKDRNETVGWWLLNHIKGAATRFETVLSEELPIVDTYSVKQKGAYSTSELIDNADAVFPAAIRPKLPPRAVADIREAGKCLAFETPTAAGFHIVRAIESVILAYYAKIVGKPMPPRMRNWGVYIKALRESGSADPKIVEFLAHIKDSYRNPVAHPEAQLTVDEVLVLLSVAVGAISQMGAAL